MTAIGEWLKQIILIVMFAVIADLLLPNKEMQRYVRMVLGLAVVAAMLQPIGAIVHTGWSDRLADLAASEVTGSTSHGDSATSLKSFESVLQGEQTNEANRFLADEIKAQIVAKFGAKAVHVKVSGRTGEAAFDVTVSVAAGTTSTKQIRAYIANTLAIAQANVTVTAGGGDSDGLEAD